METASETLIPTHVFREYDIRGRYQVEITPPFAFLLGRAFGEKVKKLGAEKVVVGRDNRLSSPELAKALISGLNQSGMAVVDIGEVTTPMFYYSLEHLDIHCGLMVTASHNPGDENGFKIAVGKMTIYGEEIQDLKGRMLRILENDGVPKDWQPSGSMTEKLDIEPAYLKMLGEKIRLGPRKVKVVVDCGNGTVSPFAPKALKQWGCEVVPLYCESDPSFPNHHPDPVDPENLKDLIRVVREEKADLGLAFDGDGDRLGVVDEQGKILWGDQLMILFWREILPKYPECQALVEVKCSQALVEEIERLGGKPVFHRTGHSHIKASMKRLDVPFTGEMSGHLFFRDEYFGFDDALYAAGRLLRILTGTEHSLSELFAHIPKYASTPETRVPCKESEKDKILQKVRAYFENRYKIIDVDGVRVLFPDGWGLVRASNTQPILVLRAESKIPEGLDGIKKEMEKALAFADGELAINW